MVGIAPTPVEGTFWMVKKLPALETKRGLPQVVGSRQGGDELHGVWGEAPDDAVGTADEHEVLPDD